MSNLRIMPKNIADVANGGTVTASPAMLTSNPETFLQQQGRKNTARTTSLASQDIKFTWAANQRCNMVALPRFTGSVGVGSPVVDATVRIYRYSDAAWTNLIDDTGALSAFSTTGLAQLDVDSFQDADFLVVKNYVKYLDLVTTMKSMKITLLDPENAAGYVEAARAVIGEYEELTYNPPYGGGLTSSIQDMSKQGRADSGANVTDKREKYFKASINPEFLDDSADIDWLMAAARYLGLDKDFWLSFYPGATGVLEYYNQGLVEFTSIPSFSPNVYGYHKSTFEIEGA